MDELITQPVFRAYIVTTIILVANVLALGAATVIALVRAGEVVNPEDRKLNDSAAVVYYGGSLDAQRRRRAHRNALENVPLFIVTGFLLSLTPVALWLAGALFGTFVLARLIHSFAYVKQIQPVRTFSFVVGLATQAVLLGALGYYGVIA